MNKIIFFTKYTEKGPSSRYRSYQYQSFIEKEFEVKYFPLFDDEYIDNLFCNKKISFLKLIKYYTSRIINVLKYLGTKNIVFIEYELLPYFPPLLEYLLFKSNVKVIFDYDDAIFHNYDLHPNPIIKYLFNNKVPFLAKYADIIITGSPYLTKYFYQHNKNIIEIPTSISFQQYINNKEKINIGNNNNEKIVVGWLGSKTTSWNLLEIKDVIDKILVENPKVIFRFCGFNIQYSGFFQSNNIEFLEWSSLNEINFLNNINIGIMPLGETLFNRGKCGFKLIQYMAMGKPTISSPLEANIKINRNNGNLFASSKSDWYESLTFMINHINYFNKIGDSNTEIIKKYYSIEENSKIMINLFKNIK
jgi:hypothetical protein